MEADENVDMTEVKTFYDPHPGDLGAVARLPEKIRKAVAALDGKRMPLWQAVADIRDVTDGEIKVVAKYKFIMLKLKPKDGKYREHSYRLIRYR